MAEPTLTYRGGERAHTGDTLLIAGKGRLWTQTLTRAEVIIGRDPGCDVVIDDLVLSRRHARLALGPPLTVEDLGSHNGTRIGDAVHRGDGPIPIEASRGFSIGAYAFLVMTASVHPTTQRSAIEQLVVVDPTAREERSLLAEIARRGINVLILGESGVGKEVLADTVHALSGRTGPLQRINCAALPEALLESELFGHEKGAFTGAAAQRIGLLESAAGGTVFLDEIGELPLGIQAKLLRAIEAREIVRLGANRVTTIDARFVFATNRDLTVEVAHKRFRHDLYFRIDGISLRIPPLRERPALIGRLALEFLANAGHTAGLPPPVLARLQAHPWPGNVRELRAVIERALLLARGGELSAGHLAFAASAAPGLTPAPPAPPPVTATTSSSPASASTGDDVPADLDPAQRAERDQLIATLEACAGNQTRAAAKLGMSRTTFVTKLRIYRIPRPRA